VKRVAVTSAKFCGRGSPSVRFVNSR